MIYTQEILILLTAAILIAATAVVAFSGMFESQLASAQSTSETVKEKISSDFSIVEVHAGNGEMNVYVQGVSGSIEFNDPVVLVDGTVATVVSYALIRDGGTTGALDPGDFGVITVSGNYADGKKHRIRVIIAPAEALYEGVLG